MNNSGTISTQITTTPVTSNTDKIMITVALPQCMLGSHQTRLLLVCCVVLRFSDKPALDGSAACQIGAIGSSFAHSCVWNPYKFHSAVCVLNSPHLFWAFNPAYSAAFFNIPFKFKCQLQVWQVLSWPRHTHTLTKFFSLILVDWIFSQNCAAMYVLPLIDIQGGTTYSFILSHKSPPTWKQRRGLMSQSNWKRLRVCGPLNPSAFF